MDSNKEFLAKEALHSSSAIHTKIYNSVKDKGRLKGQIRISDCNKMIVIWNFLDNKESKSEYLEKIDTIVNHLLDYKKKIKQLKP